MVSVHQPGQSVFKSVLPEDIEWKPFAAFPAAARLAILVGQPSEPGPYVIRVKVPTGVKLMPHRHPEDRIYTVMSGVFYIGLGETFDGDKVRAVVNTTDVDRLDVKAIKAAMPDEWIKKFTKTTPTTTVSIKPQV